MKFKKGQYIKELPDNFADVMQVILVHNKHTSTQMCHVSQGIFDALRAKSMPNTVPDYPNYFNIQRGIINKIRIFPAPTKQVDIKITYTTFQEL